MNLLKASGAIQRGIFSFYMNDDYFPSHHGSVITIGEINITYAYNITKYPFILANNTYDPNGYWKIPALAIDINTSNADYNTFIVIDSGQDWIITSKNGYNAIQAAYIGLGFTKTNGLYSKKCANTEDYPTIFIALSNDDWIQIPSYRYLSREANTSTCYLGVLQGNDNNWYIGDALLRTYYTFFDLDRAIVGFTPVTYFNPIPTPKYVKRHSSSDDDIEGWKIAVIVLSVVLGVAAIGAIVYFVKKRKAGTSSEVGKPLQEVSLHA